MVEFQTPSQAYGAGRLKAFLWLASYNPFCQYLILLMDLVSMIDLFFLIHL